MSGKSLSDTSVFSGISLRDYRIVIKYPAYMPSTYNIITDRPTDSSMGQWFEGKIEMLDDGNAELGFDYVFVNGSEASVQLAMEIYPLNGKSAVATTGTMTIPLMRGKLTEVRGKFLTTKTSEGIGIIPGFDGEFNIEIK